MAGGVVMNEGERRTKALADRVICALEMGEENSVVAMHNEWLVLAKEMQLRKRVREEMGVPGWATLWWQEAVRWVG